MRGKGCKGVREEPNYRYAPANKKKHEPTPTAVSLETTPR